jgi:hypothetical protein
VIGVSTDRWVVLKNFASGLEADIAVALLTARRIPAQARGHDIVGIFGPGFQGPSARGVDVVVPERYAARARRALADRGDSEEAV